MKVPAKKVLLFLLANHLIFFVLLQAALEWLPKKKLHNKRTFFWFWQSVCPVSLPVENSVWLSWSTTVKRQFAPVCAGTYVSNYIYVQWPYACVFVGIHIFTFLLAWSNVCEKLLSLAFICIISIASAEQWRVTNNCPTVAPHNSLSWLIQNCCCGPGVPSGSLNVDNNAFKAPNVSWNIGKHWWNVFVLTSESFIFLLGEECAWRATILLYHVQHITPQPVGQSVCSFVGL